MTCHNPDAVGPANPLELDDVQRQALINAAVRQQVKDRARNRHKPTTEQAAAEVGRARDVDFPWF